MRIVSLLPSATEIVCAVGAVKEIVGISHECDFPESVRGLPVLTQARVPSSPSSRVIDESVREAIRSALSIYTVDEQALSALAPDVIVTQDLCEVCAVSLDDVRSAVAKMAHRDGVRIVSLRPTRLADVWNDIQTVADVIGRADEGARVRRDLEGRVAAIAQRGAHAERRPRVVSVEWLDPVMLGGTWMPELIELVGGEAIGAQAGGPAKAVSLAMLRHLSPDVVLIKPCGFPIERTMGEEDLVAEVARAAGADARVYVSDGNAFFNRPGPRLVESLEIMAACVDPRRYADFASKHAEAIRRVH